VTGNLNLVETAAAELPRVGLDDALTILSLLAENADPRSDRAAARWSADCSSRRFYTDGQSTIAAIIMPTRAPCMIEQTTTGSPAAATSPKSTADPLRRNEARELSRSDRIHHYTT
jgi:hypothetical protein